MIIVRERDLSGVERTRVDVGGRMSHSSWRVRGVKGGRERANLSAVHENCDARARPRCNLRQILFHRRTVDNF